MPCHCARTFPLTRHGARQYRYIDVRTSLDGGTQMYIVPRLGHMAGKQASPQASNKTPEVDQHASLELTQACLSIYFPQFCTMNTFSGVVGTILLFIDGRANIQ